MVTLIFHISLTALGKTCGLINRCYVTPAIYCGGTLGGLPNLILFAVNIPSNIMIIYYNSCIKFGRCEMRRLNQKSTLSRIFDCFGRRYGKRRIQFKQSNLSDSNVALHMHLTLALSSAHVKFDV